LPPPQPPQIPAPPSLPLGGLPGGNFQCNLDFLSSSGPGTGNVIYAPDGSLATEFALAEAIVLATQAQGSHDPYTCLLDAEADPALLETLGLPGLDPSPLLECLDVGTATTLSGLFTDDVLLFGSAITCNGKTVSDGRINGYDLAVLTWAIFRAAPYGQVDYAAQTVIARNGTAARCGNGATLADYALALDTDFCAAGEPAQPAAIVAIVREGSAGSRALSETWGAPQPLPINNATWAATGARPQRTARALSEAGGPLQPRCLETAVDPWSVIPDLGEWTRLRFFDLGDVPDTNKLTIAVELSLVGVGNAQVRLTQAVPPPRGCVEAACAPAENPSTAITVLLQRRGDLVFPEGEEPYGGNCGASIDLSIATQYSRDRYALGGSGGLSVLQDAPGTACPFDVFIWVPASVRNELLEGVDEVCDGAVGVLPGSTAMDGLSGAVQCELFCSGDRDDPQGQLPEEDEGGAAVTIVVALIVGLSFFCCLFFLLIMLLGKKVDMRKEPPAVAGGGADEPPPAIDNLDPVAIAAMEARLDRSGDARPVEVRYVEARPGEVRSVEARPGEARPGEVRYVERSVEVQPAEGGAVKVRSVEERLDRI
jgi:hypothetical protein